MARKNYTDEFRRRAVDLYESTPGATLKGIAVDLGISRGALKEWVDKLGSGATVSGGVAVPDGPLPESQAARVARLEAENTALRAEARKLETERDERGRGHDRRISALRSGPWAAIPTGARAHHPIPRE